MSLFHPFQAVYNKDSKILILGSFPSVKSRQFGFYYANPQNRFWDILSAIFDEKIPKISLNDDKYQAVFETQREFLLSHHIAVWDIAKRCDIDNSKDSTLRCLMVNNIARICEDSAINVVFTNGNKATLLYQQYIKLPEILHFKLPSTSSANAKWKLECLINEWSKIKDFVVD